MFCVGVTGNIASGKSAAIDCFRTLGAAIISADLIAREVTAINQPALSAIREHFGDRMINSAGELDRAALRKEIFNKPSQRVWLEALLHPLIRNVIESRLATIKDSPYCLIEIPLLIGREDYPYLDRILVILADKKVQIQRILARDRCDQEQAMAILSTQPGEQARRELADDLLINNGTVEELFIACKKLHARYLQLAAQKS